MCDVKGAFLKGHYNEWEQFFMKVQRIKHHYLDDVVLRLLRTIYGLKQAAYAFWKELLKAMTNMEFERSKADPCLYYRWNKHGRLVLIVSWVDDCLIVGRNDDAMQAKKELTDRFDCDWWVSEVVVLDSWCQDLMQ